MSDFRPLPPIYIVAEKLGLKRDESGNLEIGRHAIARRVEVIYELMDNHDFQVTINRANSPGIELSSSSLSELIREANSLILRLPEKHELLEAWKIASLQARGKMSQAGYYRSSLFDRFVTNSAKPSFSDA
jgi:hypothetical protein